MGLGRPTGASESDEWGTPLDVFAALSERFGGYGVDLYASESNRLCDAFFSRERPCPAVWACRSRRLLWWNPPYSKPNLSIIVPRMRAWARLGVRSTGLVPVAPSSEWFEAVWGNARPVKSERILSGPLRGRVLTWSPLDFEGRIETLFFGYRLEFNYRGRKVESGARGASVAVTYLPERSV